MSDFILRFPGAPVKVMFPGNPGLVQKFANQAAAVVPEVEGLRDEASGWAGQAQSFASAAENAANDSGYYTTIAAGAAATTAPQTFTSDEDGFLARYDDAGALLGAVIGTPQVLTLAQAQAMTIPAAASAVTTVGVSTEAIKRPVHWRRVASEPAHGFKFQDGGGAWFEGDIANHGGIPAWAFGFAADGVTNDRAAFTAFRNAVAATGEVGILPAGHIRLSTTAPTSASTSTGLVRLRGAGKNLTKISGPTTVDMIRNKGGLDVSDIEVEGFRYQFEQSSTAGDFRVRSCYCHDGQYFDYGTINAVNYDVDGNDLFNFSHALILESSSTITGGAWFTNNKVRNVARYVYRRQHTATLWFTGNDIDGVNDGGFTGTSSVARIVMRGGLLTVIERNTIKNVVCADADCVLHYWSNENGPCDVIVRFNTFGRFYSDDDCYLVKQKSVECNKAIIHDNEFLGGDDTASFSAVAYLLWTETARDQTQITKNRFVRLTGPSVQTFRSNATDVLAPPILVDGNTVQKLETASFVGAIRGAKAITITRNWCDNHCNPASENAPGSSYLGKQVFSCQMQATTDYSEDIEIADNVWRFTNDGEGTTRAGYLWSHLLAATTAGTSQKVATARNLVTGATGHTYSAGSADQATAQVQSDGDIYVGGFSGTITGGTTTARALVTLREDARRQRTGGVDEVYGVFQGRGTTAARPTLSADNFGASYDDTTLGKMIFWTGAVWKDGAGTTV